MQSILTTFAEGLAVGLIIGVILYTASRPPRS